MRLTLTIFTVSICAHGCVRDEHMDDVSGHTHKHIYMQVQQFSRMSDLSGACFGSPQLYMYMYMTDPAKLVTNKGCVIWVRMN